MWDRVFFVFSKLIGKSHISSDEYKDFSMLSQSVKLAAPSVPSNQIVCFNQISVLSSNPPLKGLNEKQFEVNKFDQKKEKKTLLISTKNKYSKKNLISYILVY